ncbi:MAG: hypothetical protein AAGB48_00115 [Planctomycetota bacterium]
MKPPSDVDRLVTWAALLGAWTEFAKSAAAFPDDGEGGRFKRAVPSIVTIQAVTHALGEIHELPADEHALGLDRAEMAIREHAGVINQLWAGEPLPEGLVELIEDARAALALAASAGFEWAVAQERAVFPHPAELLEALESIGFAGDLFVPTPGVPLFAGCPAVFVRPDAETAADDERLATALGLVAALAEGCDGPTPGPCRQAYRQFDFARGGPVRDLVQPMDADLPAGQPLLVPAILGGVIQHVTLPIQGADKQAAVPVEFDEDSVNDR